MATGQEHYDMAEECLAKAAEMRNAVHFDDRPESWLRHEANYLAAALAHAELATAAATSSETYEEYR